MRDIVEAAWDNRELLDNAKTQETIRNVISLLDKGELRVAEKINNQWKDEKKIPLADYIFFNSSIDENIQTVKKLVTYFNSIYK